MTLHLSGEVTALFSRNIEALSSRQPDVAIRIERAHLPAGAKYAVARDGYMTYLLRTPAGRRVWLGGSSLPRVSAEALWGDFVSDGSSVVLPGLATGMEPIVLARKLPTYAAVFVAEQNPAVVRMVFELYDYTKLLLSGRLVIMTGEQVGEDIASLFSTHPGYTWPMHLLPMINLDRGWCEVVQAQLERTGPLVAKRQEEVVNRLVETIRSRPIELLSDVRRVTLLSTNTATASIAHVDALRRTLEDLHWPMSWSVPQYPDMLQNTARLGAIEKIKADLVLFIDCLPGSMSALLPPYWNTVSWFCPGAVVNASVMNVPPWRDGHMVLASSPHQRDQLVAMGVDVKHVSLLPPGACIAGVSLRPAWGAHAVGGDVPVAVLADLPDDRPETANVSLSSQLRLWESLQQVVRANVDQYDDDCWDKFLQEAQRQSGTIISDDSNRSRFRECLKQIIGPASYARAIAEWLASQNVPTTVCGANWNLYGAWQSSHKDDIASGIGASQRSSDAPIMVIPFIDDTIVPRLLNALARGTMVMARSDLQTFDTKHPGLAGIAEHIHWYRTTRDLLKKLRYFTAHAGDLAMGLRKQVAFIRDHHTIEHRLRAIDRMTR